MRNTEENGRCEERTDYQGLLIRCDLAADHVGQHELRNRSDGALVTSWQNSRHAD